MNDKIVLQYSTDKFKILDNNLIEKDVTTDKFGNVKNVKEYCNYQSNDGTNLLNIDVNSFGMKLQFNPNKYAKYDFIKDGFITYSKFTDISKEIETTINDKIGVDFRIADGTIVRYDNSFDVLTNKNFETYTNILRKYIDLKSGKIRNANEIEVNNTLYVANKSQLITCYDKTKEIKDNVKSYNYLTPGAYNDNNIMRFEYRRLKKDKSLILLHKDITEQRYYAIRTQSKSKIIKTFFNADVTSFNDYDFELLLINLLMNAGFTVHNANKILTNFAINYLDINLNNIKLKRTEPNYRNFMNFVKLHKSLIVDNDVVITLYKEIKEKLLGVA